MQGRSPDRPLGKTQEISRFMIFSFRKSLEIFRVWYLGNDCGVRCACPPRKFISFDLFKNSTRVFWLIVTSLLLLKFFISHIIFSPFSHWSQIIFLCFNFIISLLLTRFLRFLFPILYFFSSFLSVLSTSVKYD